MMMVMMVIMHMRWEDWGQSVGIWSVMWINLDVCVT